MEPARGENPLAYARQIIYRDQVSWWRRRRTGERPMASVPERATQPANQERRLLLLDALARLAPRQRQVLVMRYFDDLTEKDCAFVLGISVGTVERCRPRRPRRVADEGSRTRRRPQ